MSLEKSGSILAWQVFIGSLAQGPGRHLPESGGIPDKPSFADDFATGSGKPFPRYGGAVWMQDLLGAMEEEPKVLLREFELTYLR